VTKALKIVGFWTVLILVIGVGAWLEWFRSVDIVTYDDWCADRTGTLRARYTVPQFNFKYAVIRDDFTRTLNDQLIQSALDTFGWKNREDKAVKELIRLQMIGAWHEGTHLHLANEIGDGEGFADWESKMRAGVDMKSLEGQDNSSGEHCIAISMNDFFEDVTLHGTKKTAVIPLAYTVRGQEGSVK